jgi:hypothetical protein|tara:strand:- start:337 stop:609 length:273 start_codon:yes stop_codon:yes gene_type:complete
MNDYLVQYASVDSMVHEWTKADSHIDAAANVLIDKGFDNLMWKNDDSIIVVVCKNNYVAGLYPVSQIKTRANHMVGLPVEINHPDDWWKD